MTRIDDRTEWLEADGLGGFASGTTSGIRTRRYHALLLTATTPPTGRVVLVNGFDAAADRVYPGLGVLRAQLTDLLGATVHLTGAGPTVFAAFQDHEACPAAGAYCRVPAASGRMAIGESRCDPFGTPNHAAGRYANFCPSGKSLATMSARV